MLHRFNHEEVSRVRRMGIWIFATEEGCCKWATAPEDVSPGGEERSIEQRVRKHGINLIILIATMKKADVKACGCVGLTVILLAHSFHEKLAVRQNTGRGILNS